MKRGSGEVAANIANKCCDGLFGGMKDAIWNDWSIDCYPVMYVRVGFVKLDS